MSAPKVYKAIAKVSADIAAQGIAKSKVNESEGYSFRGIDDVYNALAPLLAKYRLCILPRVLSREAGIQRSSSGEALIAVTLKVAFDFVSADDGSMHTLEVFGEALDAGDKATNKAMSAAYKYAAFQTFCIPVASGGDADMKTHRLQPIEDGPTPVQGWKQWVDDIGEVVAVCETTEALSRLQQTNRSLLRELSRTDPSLYAQLGRIFGDRRGMISVPHALPIEIKAVGESEPSGRRIASIRCNSKNVSNGSADAACAN